MFETVVTVVGRVVGELTRRRTGDDIPVVSFRMLAQERRINRETGEWSNGDSMFISVHCWRTLGLNVAASLIMLISRLRRAVGQQFRGMDMSVAFGGR